MEKTFEETYTAAYAAMTSGDAYGGTVQLIEMLRTVPGDDVKLADALTGPSQLLGFSVASLLDWPARTQLLNDVLKPAAFPTDELLIAAMQAGSGVQGMAIPARVTLEKLSKNENRAVAVAALYILCDPYYFGALHSYDQKPAIAEMVLNYPDLDLCRCIVEMPVYNTLDKAKKEGQSRRNLLENVLLWGGRKDMVLQASPGLAKAAEALPSMNFADIDTATVTRWAEGLAGEKDTRTRYTVVSILSKTCDTPERRAGARTGLETLAALPPATADVIRARALLADFARADHDVKTLAATVQNLLTLGVLPCTAERSMYETVMKTAQHAAKYFTRMGWSDAAIRAHTTLAEKYPGTTLATEELEKAKTIEANPLQASLDLLDKESDAPLKNGDRAKVAALYRDIAEHAGNEALKKNAAQRLEAFVNDGGK